MCWTCVEPILHNISYGMAWMTSEMWRLHLWSLYYKVLIQLHDRLACNSVMNFVAWEQIISSESSDTVSSFNFASMAINCWLAPGYLGLEGGRGGHEILEKAWKPTHPIGTLLFWPKKPLGCVKNTAFSKIFVFIKFYVFWL